jgi:NAD(P)-dependent dehydrogenase (short-subunit alcohol dehydrogenase family)
LKVLGTNDTDAVAQAPASNRLRESGKPGIPGNTVNMTRAFYPLMKARGGGVIINIIGHAARTHDPNYICGGDGGGAEYFLRLAGSNEGVIEFLRGLTRPSCYNDLKRGG